jgi:hypothetical protein
MSKYEEGEGGNKLFEVHFFTMVRGILRYGQYRRVFIPLWQVKNSLSAATKEGKISATSSGCFRLQAMLVGGE